MIRGSTGFMCPYYPFICCHVRYSEYDMSISVDLFVYSISYDDSGSFDQGQYSYEMSYSVQMQLC